MNKKWHFKKWVEIIIECIMSISFIGMISVKPNWVGIVSFSICALITFGCYILLRLYGTCFND